MNSASRWTSITAMATILNRIVPLSLKLQVRLVKRSGGHREMSRENAQTTDRGEV
jgi:hypothetical protein